MNVSTITSKIHAAIPKVASGARKFAGKPLLVTSKILGAACVAGVIYDAHVNGKERAVYRNDTAQRIFGQYDQYLTMDKESGTIAKLKKQWFGMQQAYPFNHTGSRTKGYIKGLGQTLFRNLPIIGLSALALSYNKVGKVAGVILGGIAAREVCNDVLGIGNQRNKL